MSYLTDERIVTDDLVRETMRPEDGACIVFEGVVRNHNDGKAVQSIFYDAYRSMAEKEIERVIEEVRRAHPAVAVTVRHRLGHLEVGDASIAIICTSPHRADAYEASRMTIDTIKKRVPIWKKEFGPSGEEWVGWQGGAP
jgi:molybdopterin synthase catalytic subunit